MQRFLVFLVTVFIITTSLVTDAQTLPRSVEADHRIKMVQYDPNNVVILKARYGYQTQIVFAQNEIVQNVSLGDSLAWQAVPVKNYLFIKPVAESTTNMTVLTNLNSYSFQLDSTHSTIRPTFKLQFIYPGTSYENHQTNSIPLESNKLNWKYSFTGDSSQVPTKIFDDGKFTYFQFTERHLPAIFSVDKNRNESLVNYHLQDNYLVVNTIAKQFTLRSGAIVTSIYNDAAIGDWQDVK